MSATTTSGCSAESTRRRCAPRTPSATWQLSRAVSGEVMAAVFGEWRRAASPCRGGLVLWSRDLEPGAGWGLLDCDGRPKVAYHHLRAALAPEAVWMTDEGLNGVDVHLANERPEPFVGAAARRPLPRLRAACRRGGREPRPGPRETAHPQRRGAARALRRRLLGLPVRPARAGPDRRRPRARGRGRLRAGLQGIPIPGRTPGRHRDAGGAGPRGGARAQHRGRPGAAPPLAALRRRAAGFEAPGFEPGEDAISLEPGVARESGVAPG